MQPLLLEYIEYGETVAMRILQALLNGDPSHEEGKGAKTHRQYDEAAKALLKKAYADETARPTRTLPSPKHIA